MVGFALVHFVVFSQPGLGEGGVHEVWAFQSWRLLLAALAVGSTLFWVGDYLRRSY
jgi:hypothetical protein